jgi:NADPH:quinone reductase
MKAIVCSSYGPPANLQYVDIDDPIVGRYEVLIRVHACSVNFPDTLIIQGLYQFKPEFPFSPGSDIAGVVESIGSEVTNWKIGDEVIAMIPFGGFAEKVSVHKSVIFPKPPKMDMIQAASFLLAYGTSYYALLDRAKVHKGESLLVLGAAGGVGLTAVELGKVLGATVIAAASSDEKLALCKEYGAEYTINYTTENIKDKVKEITEGKGVDVIYDPVGGPLAEQALRAIGWEGRYLVIGFASGEIPKIPLNLTLLKSCQIVGVFWGAFAQKFPGRNMQQVTQLIQWCNEGTLKPHISKVYNLQDAPQALEAVMNREVKGKIVIEIQ